MDQHPIPQNVTKYQFRLIGDMTIKQFGVLLAGGILGVIVYKLPLLPSFFSVPLAGIFIAGGAAMAFVPFEERTLDIWLINFIRAIYNPTQYLWTKTKDLPPFFTYTAKANQAVVVPQIPQSDRSQLEAYLNSLKIKSQNPLDQYEQASLQKIGSLFQTSSSSTPPPPSPLPPTPLVGNLPAGQQPRMIKEPPKAAVINDLVAQSQARMVEGPQITQAPSLIPEPVAPSSVPAPVITPAPPLTPPIKMLGLDNPQFITRPKPNEPATWSEGDTPQTPDVPNTIVGVATTQDARLIHGVLIEVRDHDDMPIRVAKTNATGQFYIATPLKNGRYTISPEHPQYSFDTMDLEVNGTLIPALRLVAREPYQAAENQTTANQ